jgi:Ni/Co efflux regulator RcnB
MNNTNKLSKRMTTVAAVLALCMAGSAFAQDRRGDDRGPRGQDQRHEQHDRRDARNDRQDFRDGRQADRRGYPQPHAEWRRGGRVPQEYRGRNYVVNDYRAYQLQQPPRGYQWVGVGGDFVLAAIATGVIAQIIASH